MNRLLLPVRLARGLWGKLPRAWVLRLPVLALLLMMATGLIFSSVVAVQAQINKEEFANQAAETLRKVIGLDMVCRIEYTIFSAQKVLRRAFPHKHGTENPRVAALLAQPSPPPVRPAEGDCPAAIEPLLTAPAMPDEGRWTSCQHGVPGLWVTNIRPSAEDPDKVARLVAVDLRRIKLNYVPGTDVTRSNELSMVPPADRPALVAVFNSDYRGDYPKDTGQRKNGKVYRALKDDRGTIVMEGNAVEIGRWSASEATSHRAADIRQNLPLLLEKGQHNKKLLRFMEKRHLDFPTRRTALGLTADHRWLILALGRRLEPHDLAVTLQLAACPEAVHLDQNGGNVFFELVQKREPELVFVGISPAFQIAKCGKVLTGNKRDFFYLTRLDTKAGGQKSTMQASQEQ